MLRLNVAVYLTPAVAALERAKTVLSDLSEFWADKVEPDVTLKLQQQFATSGAAGGVPWAPLRPATLDAKARANRAGMGILRFYDVLYQAYTMPGGVGSIRLIDPQSYTRGVSGGTVPYAQFHQTGWVATRWGHVVFHVPRQVPARPVIPDPVPDAWLADWSTMLTAYLKEKLAGEGA